MLRPIYENIPDEIKVFPQWLLWKEEPRKDDSSKMTKPPYQPNCRHAKSDNPETWSSFDTVKAVADRFDGVGFVLTQDDPFVGLDFDKCRCPAFDNLDPEMAGGLNMVLPRVADYVKDLDSYTELSPRAKGLHVFLKGRLPVDGKKKGDFEAYQAGRYVTVTGHSLPELPTTICDRQAELDVFYQTVFAAPTKKDSLPLKKVSQITTEAPPNKEISPADEDKVRDVIIKSKQADLFVQLMEGDWEAKTIISGKKYPSQSESDFALMRMLAFYTRKNAALMKMMFMNSMLYRTKCEEIHSSDGQTYLDKLIEKAIESCEEVYDPDYYNDLQSHLKKFNDKYAVSMLGNRCVIIDETCEEVVFLRLIDFKQFHQTLKISVKDADGKERTYVVVDHWIKWEGRRQYPRIEFKPGENNAPNYNLWQGFSVIAKCGDWSLMQYHIEKVICRGNEKYYHYVYKWIARIYQNPGGSRPGVAIVLRGKPGVGKGVFARYIGKPLEKHFVHVFSPHQFSGKFNAHLKMCILLFADEAFMTEKKESTSILRGMITEPYIMCEPKGIDAYRIENHINVIAAGNASYLVPAGEAERRFFVIDVSDKHMQDTEYFKKLCAQMDNGGVEAMFYDLLKLDISKVDLRDFPHSSALFDQQLRGMNPIQKWWFECLRFGTVCHNLFGKDNKSDWCVIVSIAEVFDSFTAFLESITIKNTYTPSLFGRELRKFCPTINRPRKKDDDKNRVYYYGFPPLDECRKLFCDAMKYEIQWDDF